MKDKDLFKIIIMLRFGRDAPADLLDDIGKKELIVLYHDAIEAYVKYGELRQDTLVNIFDCSADISIYRRAK